MSTVDQKQKRAFLEAAISPVALLPFIGGGTGGAVMLALGASPLLAIGVAAGSVAFGIGTALFRAFNSDAIKSKVEKEILAENRLARNQEIKNLRNELSKDEISLLNDVLGLQQVLESSIATDATQIDVLNSTKELLEQTYLILLKIPNLYNVKRTVSSSKKATKAIQDQIDKIAREAKENVDCAATVVAEFQGIGDRTNGQGEIRKQLSGRLEAAKVFDGQLSSLQLGIAPEMLAQYAQAAN
jgi:hypothetical protein